MSSQSYNEGVVKIVATTTAGHEREARASLVVTSLNASPSPSVQRRDATGVVCYDAYCDGVRFVYHVYNVGKDEDEPFRFVAYYGCRLSGKRNSKRKYQLLSSVALGGRHRLPSRSRATALLVTS